jgi:hypothetical protein
MTTYTKDSILEQLRSKEMIVTFNKVNGDERVMTCTLKPELIPESVQPKETGREPSAKELENIRVYDVNAEGWRSFKVANVTNVQTLDEAHTELVQTLENKTRYINLTIWGYGGESAYISLSKEAYDFWKPLMEEHGDGDIISYMLSAEDEDPPEYEHIKEVPEEAQFLHWKHQGELHASPWYEAPDEFEHQWGVDWSNAQITIEERDSSEYNSNIVEEIVDGMDIGTWTRELEEKHNYDIEMVEMGVSKGSDEEPEYVLQIMSSEKGTFFEGTIETKRPFDPTKLKFFTEEFLNGDDTITNIEYDGEEVDNSGGDTNGKGYYAYAWKN